VADKFEFKLNVPSPAGVTTVHLGIGTEPIRMADLAGLVYQIADRAITQCVEKVREEGSEPSCRSGCSHCCRQLVPLSGPEAFRLADAAIALDSEPRQALFVRFEEAKHRVDQAGLMPTLTALITDNATADLETLAHSYFQLGVDCPFLVDNRCSVYEVRPNGCRSLTVTTPSDWCKAPTLHQILTVPMPRAMSQPLAAMFSKLTGRPEELIPLPLAFDWVEENSELGMQRWPGPELFQAFVAELNQ
jgi:Fe-S-cluster containining protein